MPKAKTESADSTLAIKLQQKEWGAQPKPREKPIEPVAEGEEYTFFHKEPLRTFVCMYPEFLAKRPPPNKSEATVKVSSGIES